MRRIFKVGQGVFGGVLVFFVLVWGLAQLSSYADTSLLRQKVVESFQLGDFEYPNQWALDLNDWRGVDKFTDCLAVDVILLNAGGSFREKFDAFIYKGKVERKHPCNTLYEAHVEQKTEEFLTSNYNRYWWGSAVVARIILGFTDLSIGQYRHGIHTSSFVSLILFSVAFFYVYRRKALVFVPLFLSILLGYGMLTLGQSLSQAPEFIVGLLLLSLYGVFHVQSRSMRARAFWYSLLGAVCVYFDLLNGHLAFIAVMLSCQMMAPFLFLKKRNSSLAAKEMVMDIMGALTFMAIGICAAVFIRVLGYSMVSQIGLLDAVREWFSFFAIRVSGEAPVYTGKEISQNLYALLESVPPLLALAKIVHHRYEPFQGVLSGSFVDLFYFVGFVSWGTALIYCWWGRKKETINISVVFSFILSGAIIPAWFLLLPQHTIVHAWMTGRLVSVFCGLGVSFAVWVAMSVRRQRKKVSCDGS